MGRGARRRGGDVEPVDRPNPGVQVDGRDRRTNIRDVMRESTGGTLPARFKSILEVKAIVLTRLGV